MSRQAEFSIFSIDTVSVLQKSSVMSEIDWIRKGLEKPGKTQKGLAEALGRAPSAVTNLLKNKRELKQREVSIIARYLEVDPPPRGGGSSLVRSFDPDATDSEEPPTVPLVGYVGAGAEAHFYAVGPGDLDAVVAPEGSTESTVAVEIRGDSLGSFFDRWLVFYDDVRRPVTPDLIGRLCVVELEDGRVLIKKLRRSKHPGLYDLLSNTQEPIPDAAIRWAARVKHMMPK